MITKLQLRNWRSHSLSDFEFSDGVNALLGIMGSGKSSAMDAISFALFGTFPTLQQRKIKLEDVIRNKPEQAQKAEVQLEFIGPDKKAYTVSRVVELGKGTTSSMLKRDSEVIESPNSQRVTEQVSRALKIDYDIFSRAVYSEQNQLDYFLNIPKGQRMAQIDKLLRIDRFENARKSATSLLNRMADELTSKESLSKELLPEEEAKALKELESERVRLDKKMAELEQNSKDAAEAKKGAENVLKSLKEEEAKSRELEREMEGLAGQALQLDKRIGSFGIDLSNYSAEAVGKELAELKGQQESLKTLKRELDALNTREKELKATTKALEKAIEDSKKGVEKLGFDRMSLVELKEKYDSLTSKYNLTDHELGKIQESFEDLRVQRDVLERDIEKAEALLIEKNKMEGLATELLGPETTKEMLAENYKKLIESISEAEKKIEAYKVQRDYASQVIEDLGKENKCPLCKTHLDEARAVGLFSEQQQHIAKFEERQEEIQSLLRSLMAEKVKQEEIINRLGECDKRIKELEAAEKEAKKSRELLEKLGPEEKGLKDKVTEQKGKLEQIQKEILDSKLAISLMEGTEESAKKLQETEAELRTNAGQVTELGQKYSPEAEEAAEARLKELEKAKEGLTISEAATALGKRLEEIKKELKGLEFSSKELEKAQQEYNELQKNSEKYSSELAGTKELAAEKGKRLAELSKKKGLLEQYKKDIRWIKDVQRELTLFQSALKKTQETLRKDFIEIVNEVMHEIWGTLYPYGDLNSVKLEIEDRDYVLKVKGTNGWVNVEGRVSGGERSLASLALRIAFSLALAPNLSWLVLDEPTHNLDTESIDELSITLRERLPDLIDQIFLITHEERLESAVSGYLYRLERNKELDEPTKVSLAKEKLAS